MSNLAIALVLGLLLFAADRVLTTAWSELRWRRRHA